VPFGTEKLEWFGFPIVKKFEDTFIHFDRIHERDGRTHTQTHRQTPRDGIDGRPRFHSIARKKNDVQACCNKQDSLMMALHCPSALYTNAPAECDNLTRRSTSYQS